MKCFALLLLASTVLAQSAPSNNWIDQTENWNTPGASIPQAPKTQSSNNLSACTISIRQAALPEDAMVEAAGWTLTGPAKIHGSTTVITGMADADGMCRPLDYQVFVFTDGKFSGTLSPVPMNSRTDGSLQQYELYKEGYIIATFSRYTPSDALCCPSASSRIVYEVTTENDTPVLVPQLPGETNSVQ